MRLNHCASAVLIALTLAGVLPVTRAALAADVTHSQVQGVGAEALFLNVDEVGGTVTTVMVSVDEGRGVFPLSGVDATFHARLVIFVTPILGGPILVEASSDVDFELDDEAFQINERLDAARLVTTIPVFDKVSGSSFDVSVDLTWTGDGSLDVGQRHVHFQFARCINNFHFVGKSRVAEASGTVSHGTVNYTPSPSGSALLRDTASGFVRVGCS